MSQEEMKSIHQAINELRKSNDAQFQNLRDDMQKKFDQQALKLDPMYDIFTQAGGFGGIAVFILKGVILIGTASGIIYGLIIYLKQ